MADFPPPSDFGVPASGGPVYTLSSWGKRVLGGLVDASPFLIAYVIGLIFDSALGTAGLFTGLGWLGALAFTIWNLVRQGNTGQTVGKKVVGIKLVRESDAQLAGVGPSLGRYGIHFVLSLFCGIPALISYLWPLWDPKRQTLADKALKTVVIDA